MKVWEQDENKFFYSIVDRELAKSTFVRVSATVLVKGSSIAMYGDYIIDKSFLNESNEKFNDKVLDKINTKSIGPSGDHVFFLGKCWMPDKDRVPVRVFKGEVVGFYISGINGRVLNL